MIQSSLDRFAVISQERKTIPSDHLVYLTPSPLQPAVSRFDGYQPVLVLSDINVAWADRDWYLRRQDIVYLDPRLVSLLVKRGIARAMEVR
ncbi:MAG: hypothetical protein B2I17_10060 [Thermoplasmatales archaeon B_DKE]|nr:MAG: hypothetical protein B2I17_10060 [Thermoplasmatales archaeon B_DKE]